MSVGHPPAWQEAVVFISLWQWCFKNVFGYFLLRAMSVLRSRRTLLLCVWAEFDINKPLRDPPTDRPCNEVKNRIEHVTRRQSRAKDCIGHNSVSTYFFQILCLRSSPQKRTKYFKMYLDTVSYPTLLHKWRIEHVLHVPYESFNGGEFDTIIRCFFYPWNYFALLLL